MIRPAASNALTVASAFIDTRVTAYGIPDSVLSDQGPQFASDYSRTIQGLLGIALNYTSPYHLICGGAPSRVGQPTIPLDHCVHYAVPLQLWGSPHRYCEPEKAPAHWHREDLSGKASRGETRRRQFGGGTIRRGPARSHPEGPRASGQCPGCLQACV